MGGLLRGALLAGLLAMSAAQANAETAFCAGFKAGWEATFKNRNMLPALTPLCPLPPLNGNSFPGGYEAGMMAALQHIGQRGY